MHPSNEAIAVLTESIYIKPEDIVGTGIISNVTTPESQTMEVYNGQSFFKPIQHSNSELTIQLDYMASKLTSMLMAGNARIMIIKDKGDLSV